jgi:hypothetical protein
MSEIMKGYLPKDKLQKIWEDLENQVGTFQNIEKVNVIPVQKWFQVNVTCRFATEFFIISYTKGLSTIHLIALAKKGLSSELTSISPRTKCQKNRLKFYISQPVTKLH